MQISLLQENKNYAVGIHLFSFYSSDKILLVFLEKRLGESLICQKSCETREPDFKIKSQHSSYKIHKKKLTCENGNHQEIQNAIGNVAAVAKCINDSQKNTDQLSWILT